MDIKNLTASGDIIIVGDNSPINSAQTDKEPNRTKAEKKEALVEKIRSKHSDFLPIYLKVSGDALPFQYQNSNLKRFLRLVPAPDSEEKPVGVDVDQVAKILQENARICLHGGIGAGKSTVSREIALRIIESEEPITTIYMDAASWDYTHGTPSEYVKQYLEVESSETTEARKVTVIIDGFLNIRNNDEYYDVLHVLNEKLDSYGLLITARENIFDERVFTHTIELPDFTSTALFEFLGQLDEAFDAEGFREFLSRSEMDMTTIKHGKSKKISSPLDALIYYSIYLRYQNPGLPHSSAGYGKGDVRRVFFVALFNHYIEDSGLEDSIDPQLVFEWLEELSAKSYIQQNNGWTTIPVHSKDRLYKLVASSGILNIVPLVNGGINVRFIHDFIRDYFLSLSLSSESIFFPTIFKKAKNSRRAFEIGEQFVSPLKIYKDSGNDTANLCTLAEANPFLYASVNLQVLTELQLEAHQEESLRAGLRRFLLPGCGRGFTLRFIRSLPQFLVSTLSVKYLVYDENPAVRKMAVRILDDRPFRGIILPLVFAMTDENRSVRKLARDRIMREFEDNEVFVADAISQVCTRIDDDRISLLKSSLTTLYRANSKRLANFFSSPEIYTLFDGSLPKALEGRPTLSLEELLKQLGTCSSSVAKHVINEISRHYRSKEDVELLVRRMNGRNSRLVRRIPRALARMRVVHVANDLEVLLVRWIETAERNEHFDAPRVVVHILKALNSLAPTIILRHEDRCLALMNPAVGHHTILSRIRNNFAPTDLSKYYQYLSENEDYASAAVEVIIHFGRDDDIELMMQKVNKASISDQRKHEYIMKALKRLSSSAYSSTIISYVLGRGSTEHMSFSRPALRLLVDINGEKWVKRFLSNSSVESREALIDLVNDYALETLD